MVIEITLSIEEYLSKNRPYLRPYIRPYTDIINDLKKSDTWNIKLTIAIKGIVWSFGMFH